MAGKRTWAQMPELEDAKYGTDILRTALIETLAQNKGAIKLQSLQDQLPLKTSSRSLAQSVRDAALDGLVDVDNNDLVLTPLGFKVVENG